MPNPQTTTGQRTLHHDNNPPIQIPIYPTRSTDQAWTSLAKSESGRNLSRNRASTRKQSQRAQPRQTRPPTQPQNLGIIHTLTSTHPSQLQLQCARNLPENRAKQPRGFSGANIPDRHQGREQPKEQFLHVLQSCRITARYNSRSLAKRRQPLTIPQQWSITNTHTRREPSHLRNQRANSGTIPRPAQASHYNICLS